MTKADYMKDGRFYCRKFFTRAKALTWLNANAILQFVLSDTCDSLL